MIEQSNIIKIETLKQDWQYIDNWLIKQCRIINNATYKISKDKHTTQKKINNIISIKYNKISIINYYTD